MYKYKCLFHKWKWNSDLIEGILRYFLFVFQILRCISQLELAQLIGTSAKSTQNIRSHKREKSNGGVHPIEAFDPEGSALLMLMNVSQVRRKNWPIWPCLFDYGDIWNTNFKVLHLDSLFQFTGLYSKSKYSRAYCLSVCLPSLSVCPSIHF